MDRSFAQPDSASSMPIRQKIRIPAPRARAPRLASPASNPDRTLPIRRCVRKRSGSLRCARRSDSQALVVISAKAEGPWIVEDCALAAENLMLAAYAAGLGTCWIGFEQSYLNTAAGKTALGAPATWARVAPITVGHPAEAPAPVLRKPPEIRLGGWCRRRPG